MKRFIFSIVALLGLSQATFLAAQTPLPLSPEINANHMVTFRLFAPEAKEVVVDGQWPNGHAAMTRSDNGVWSVSVGPVALGIWEYDFSVDGRRILDPDNPSIKPMSQPLVNLLHIITNPPPIQQVVSPEIAANRMVTFRLRAPNARTVILGGQWPEGQVAMAKNSNGIWSVTTGPIAPGVWEYNFQVDGLDMIDPDNSMIKPMRRPVTSILQIQGQPPLPWDLQNVPHGTVHMQTYYSKALGRFREVVIYTPPGYEQETRKRFPVLYLQHGYGDNQETWTVHGKANWILDNLIAQGRAKPMIIVMMDGHAALPVEAPSASFLDLKQARMELGDGPWPDGFDFGREIPSSKS